MKKISKELFKGFLLNPANAEKSNKQIIKETGWSERSIRLMKAKIGKSNPQPNQSGSNEVSFNDRVKKFLLGAGKKSVTVAELTDQFECGVSKIKDAIAELHRQGINIHVTDIGVEIAHEIPKADPTYLPIPKGNVIRFGYVTDNHLGSRYERLDVLNSLYDTFADEGIDLVFNSGNMIDGEARFNKFDLHTFGLDGQTDYLIKNYPQRDGIVTRFITGDDHEGWYTQREGIDVGKHIQLCAEQAGRKDLVYLGHMEHDVIIKSPKGETTIRVQHPGGGSSYAISYTSQKLVESLSGGEKPDILLIGHYHKAAYNFIRNIHCVQGGCTMDQSPFMRKKRLSAHVGGWLIEATVNERGEVIRFKSEFIPFFDKGFYKWEYKMSL